MTKQIKWTKECKVLVLDLLADGFSYKNPIKKECGAYIPDDANECDFHLLEKYHLSHLYDSEDLEGLCPMYNEDDVIKALRQAELVGKNE